MRPRLTLSCVSAYPRPDFSPHLAYVWQICLVARKRKSPLRWNECSGLSGADGSRNRDLFDANEALYQLSYGPKSCLATR